MDEFSTSNSTVRTIPRDPSVSLLFAPECEVERICSSLPLSCAPLAVVRVAEYWFSPFVKSGRSLRGIEPRGCPYLRVRDVLYPPDERPRSRGTYRRMKGRIAVIHPPNMPRLSSMAHHMSASVVTPDIKSPQLVLVKRLEFY